MEKSAIVSEPALERWDEEVLDRVEDRRPGTDVFRLSGGVLGPTTKTSNRIDGLLMKMLEHQGSAKYLGDIDKNLDYLYTCLQLDLIERVAKEYVPSEEEEIQEEVPEPVISLDRVRLSY